MRGRGKIVGLTTELLINIFQTLEAPCYSSAHAISEGLFFAFCLTFSTVIANAQASPPSSAIVQAGDLPAGVTLPKTGMVYVSDANATTPGLVQLHASEIVSNPHAAGNFARGEVFMGAHASVELKGLNAPVHFTGTRISLYVRINSEDPELLRQRVHLIRMEQTKDRRVVLNYSQNLFGGQRAKKFNDIAVTKVDAEPDVWLKLTPTSRMEPGEYGIVFMPKDASLAPDTVYDFDVAFDAAKPDKK